MEQGVGGGTAIDGQGRVDPAEGAGRLERVIANAGVAVGDVHGASGRAEIEAAGQREHHVVVVVALVGDVVDDAADVDGKPPSKAPLKFGTIRYCRQDEGVGAGAVDGVEDDGKAGADGTGAAGAGERGAVDGDGVAGAGHLELVVVTAGDGLGTDDAGVKVDEVGRTGVEGDIAVDGEDGGGGGGRVGYRVSRLSPGETVPPLLTTRLAVDGAGAAQGAAAVDVDGVGTGGQGTVRDQDAAVDVDDAGEVVSARGGETERAGAGLGERAGISGRVNCAAERRGRVVAAGVQGRIGRQIDGAGAGEARAGWSRPWR